MKDMDRSVMQMIAQCGLARSRYIEAIRYSKKGCLDKAKQSVEEADEALVLGHRIHFQMIQNDAQNELCLSLLLVHAEDIMMSAENFKILSLEFMDLHQRIK